MLWIAADAHSNVSVQKTENHKAQNGKGFYEGIRNDHHKRFRGYTFLCGHKL